MHNWLSVSYKEKENKGKRLASGKERNRDHSGGRSRERESREVRGIYLTL